MAMDVFVFPSKWEGLAIAASRHRLLDFLVSCHLPCLTWPFAAHMLIRWIALTARLDELRE